MQYNNRFRIVIRPSNDGGVRSNYRTAVSGDFDADEVWSWALGLLGYGVDCYWSVYAEQTLDDLVIGPYPSEFKQITTPVKSAYAEAAIRPNVYYTSNGDGTVSVTLRWDSAGTGKQYMYTVRIQQT